MPPDITAGLMALAGPLPPTGPPGAASTSKPADPPSSSTLSAALFASLLTQSSPPSLKLAAPTTDAPPTVKLGSAAKQQTLKNWKTMDTLPVLSFPAAGTALKASELLSSSPAAHKAEADDKTATDAAQNAVDLAAAAANALNSVPNAALTVMPIVVPVQAVLLPVLTPAAVPAPMLSRASENAAPSVSSVAAPLAASAVPAPIARPAPNTPFTLVGSAQPQSAPVPAPFIAPVPAPFIAPVPAFLPPAISLLPQSSQTPPQSLQALAPQALSAAVPQGTGQVAAQEKPAPTETVPAKLIAGLAQALPHAGTFGPVTPGRAVPTQPLSPAQAAPLLLPPAPAQAVPNTASTVALGALVQPAPAAPTVAAPAPLFSGPAKPLGKPIPTALKLPAANADTYTRITSAGIEAKPVLTNVPTLSAKAVLPAKLPELDLGSRSVPEKTGDAKAEAKAPVGTLESGTLEVGTLRAAQAAPAAGLSSRPLTAADQIKIVHQVADGVGAMPLPAKPGGVEQMSLQLHPKDWGSLQVSVAVSPAQEAGAAKTVTAHIVAETPQVKAALQSQSGALHQALRASGLNLTHLTVSVKPAEETARPAAQSASAGFSGGQGQPDTSSREAQPVHTAAGSQSAGMQFGTSAGSSQSGRQGQPPVFTSNRTQAEAEEIAPAQLPMRPSSRIDTHA